MASSHRLFIVYADCAVQQVCYLGVDAAAGHVAVLSHADVGVAEVIGADPSRESFIVDECGDRLAEAVGGRFCDPQFLPRSAPLLAEVVRVAEGAGARRLAASQTISPAAVACGKRRVAFGGQFKHMNFARSAVDLDERSRRQRPGSALGVDHTREPELAGHHGGV